MNGRDHFIEKPLFAADLPFGARSNARAIPQPSDHDLEPCALAPQVGNPIPLFERHESISRMFKQKSRKTGKSQATGRVIHDLKRLGEIAQAKMLAHSIQRKTGLAIDPEEVDRLLRLLKCSV